MQAHQRKKAFFPGRHKRKISYSPSRFWVFLPQYMQGLIVTCFLKLTRLRNRTHTNAMPELWCTSSKLWYGLVFGRLTECLQKSWCYCRCSSQIHQRVAPVNKDHPLTIQSTMTCSCNVSLLVMKVMLVKIYSQIWCFWLVQLGLIRLSGKSQYSRSLYLVQGHTLWAFGKWCWC